MARLGRGHRVSVLASWANLVASLRTQTDLGLAAWLQVKASLDLHHRLQFLATAYGFPVPSAGRSLAMPGRRAPARHQPRWA